MPKTIKELPTTVFLRWASLVAAFWLAAVGGATAIFLDRFYVGVALLSVATVVTLIYGPWLARKGLHQPTRAESKAYWANKRPPNP